MRGLRRSYWYFWASFSRFKKLLILVYLLALAAYITIGLQSATASESGYLLSIPAIDLNTTTVISRPIDRKLVTPDYLPGVYHTESGLDFLFGHSTTIFRHLPKLKIGQEITYYQKNYRINKIENLLKSDINMTELLTAREDKQLVLMTCSGQPLPNQDATHRLIIYAEKNIEPISTNEKL